MNECYSEPIKGKCRCTDRTGLPCMRVGDADNSAAFMYGHVRHPQIPGHDVPYEGRLAVGCRVCRVLVRRAVAVRHHSRDRCALLYRVTEDMVGRSSTAVTPPSRHGLKVGHQRQRARAPPAVRCRIAPWGNKLRPDYRPLAPSPPPGRLKTTPSCNALGPALGLLPPCPTYVEPPHTHPGNSQRVHRRQRRPCDVPMSLCVGRPTATWCGGEHVPHLARLPVRTPPH
jgi:hypothetical protein